MDGPKRKHSTPDLPSDLHPSEPQTQITQEIKRYKAMEEIDTSGDLSSEWMETYEEREKHIGNFELLLPSFYSDMRPGKMVQLYNAFCQYTKQEMVVKEQPLNLPGRTELKVLQWFAFSKYCPKYHGYAVDGTNLFIGIEKLSTDFWVIQQKLCNRRYTRNSAARAGVQFLGALEDLHSTGVAHGDIKTRNFMVTDLTSNGSDNVRLIDFGTARAWRNKDGVPIKPKNIGRLVGTYRYASVAVQSHVAPTRADDIISLLYTIYEMIFGDLPWVHDGIDDSPDEMLRKKRGDHNLLKLAREISPSMEEYAQHAMQRKYDSSINYQLLKTCIEQIPNEKGIDNDHQYDWIVQQV